MLPDDDQRQSATVNGTSLFHLGRQLDRLPGDHEHASSQVMDRSRLLAFGVDPGFDDFQDEKVVFRGHPGVDNSAFEVGVALVDERCVDLGGRSRRRY